MTKPKSKIRVLSRVLSEVFGPKGSVSEESECFHFPSDSADNSVTYDVVKNRLSQSEAESLARRNLIRKNQNVSIFF